MNAVFRQFIALVRRYPLAAISLALFVLLSVANYLLWDHQKLLVQRHLEVQRNGATRLQALTGQARISAELTAAEDALTEIDRNLVVEADLAENLGYFYQMETQAKVRLSQLNQLSSQPPPEGNPYRAIPYSLRVTGTYSQIMNFVRALETGPRLLQIRSFSFARADATNNTLALDLIVEILGRQ